MADQPISQLTEFTPIGRLLIPVVDPMAAIGTKNGYITIAALQAYIGLPSSSSGSTPDESLTVPAFTTMVAALPTAAPSTPGTLWLDSGLITVTDGGVADTFVPGSLSSGTLISMLLSLPTSLPSTAGTLWLDDGILSLTPGGVSGSYSEGAFTLANFTALALSLPTTLPSTPGVLWNNSGAIAKS